MTVATREPLGCCVVKTLLSINCSNKKPHEIISQARSELVFTRINVTLD